MKVVFTFVVFTKAKLLYKMARDMIRKDWNGKRLHSNLSYFGYNCKERENKKNVTGWRGNSVDLTQQKKRGGDSYISPDSPSSPMKKNNKRIIIMKIIQKPPKPPPHPKPRTMLDTSLC
jgi:hypothetical protein